MYGAEPPGMCVELPRMGAELPGMCMYQPVWVQNCPAVLGVVHLAWEWVGLAGCCLAWLCVLLLDWEWLGGAGLGVVELCWESLRWAWSGSDGLGLFWLAFEWWLGWPGNGWALLGVDLCELLL